MNRIKSILSFIDENDKVVDIGCDQAKLSILLAKKGIKSIALDVSEKVIEKAKETINKLNLNEYVDLRISDGLDNISKNEADVAVLSGIGTHTIIKILSNTDLKFKKIITISNKDHDILRIKMNELNYIVDKELIIKEKDIYYNLILFVLGNKQYNEEEILLGTNHIDEKIYKEYKVYLLNKYTNIKTKSKNKNSKVNKLIGYLSR